MSIRHTNSILILMLPADQLAELLIELSLYTQAILDRKWCKALEL